MPLVSVKGNDVSFERNVIHNLYRINKKLNYVDNELLPKKMYCRLLQKHWIILKNESIAFDVCDKADENLSINLYISKKSFTSWDEVYRRLESSLRKVSHTRNTNETKIRNRIKS